MPLWTNDELEVFRREIEPPKMRCEVDRPVKGDVAVTVTFTLPHDTPNLRAIQFAPEIQRLIAEGEIVEGAVTHHHPLSWKEVGRDAADQ